MMPPDFGQLEVWPHKETSPYRVLPFDIYECDEAELQARFVDYFPHSSSRKPIYQGFLKLRKEAATNGIQATQWVDGSYLSSKIDPDDIDVVTFIDRDELNALPQDRRDFVERLLNGGDDTKPDYKSHTFLLSSCSSSHPYYPVFEAFRLYWLDLWGHTYEDKNTGKKEPKGFLEMTVGNAPHPMIAR